MPNQDFSVSWLLWQGQPAQQMQPVWQAQQMQAPVQPQAQQTNLQNAPQPNLIQGNVDNQYQQVFQQQAAIPQQQTYWQPTQPINRFWVWNQQQIEQPNAATPIEPIQPQTQQNPIPPVVEPPAVKTPDVEPPVQPPQETVDDIKKAAEEAALKLEIDKEEEEKKKTEIKQDIEGKDDSYIWKIMDSLLKENTQAEYWEKRAKEQAKYLESKVEEQAKQINDLMYNRVNVDDKHKQLFRMLSDIDSSPDDKEKEKRLVSVLYDTIWTVSWVDQSAQIQWYYNKSLEAVNSMSQPIIWGWQVKVPEQKQTYKPSGVVRWATKSRF